jgi:hypothetical protein
VRRLLTQEAGARWPLVQGAPPPPPPLPPLSPPPRSAATGAHAAHALLCVQLLPSSGVQLLPSSGVQLLPQVVLSAAGDHDATSTTTISIRLRGVHARRGAMWLDCRVPPGLRPSPPSARRR